MNTSIKSYRKVNVKITENNIQKFKNRTIFYVIQPPKCIPGFKIGIASNGVTRLGHYLYMYGSGAKLVRVVEFQYDKNKFPPGRMKDAYKRKPHYKFEAAVKAILRQKPNQILANRGSEVFKDLQAIDSAIAKVMHRATKPL